MGMLRIMTWGSFRPVDKTFKAQTNGHEVAVEDALAFLQTFLDEARVQDSRLRKQGFVPDDSFAEADKRKAARAAIAKAKGENQ